MNTVIIHRADRFGLASLSVARTHRALEAARLRLFNAASKPTGDVGRAETRSHAGARQSGAGFMLASHDLDIRGAGNLLGDEQSGHIKEVGIELYHQMLEEAVAAAKSTDDHGVLVEDQWTPQMDIGLPVLIPEAYVPDLGFD